MSFVPMLATNCENLDALSSFVTDDAWALEQKIDGHRRALVAGDRIVPVNRRGEPSTLPPMVQAGLTPLPDGFVLDGELLDDVLYVFDLPRAATLLAPTASLVERREVLERLFSLWEHDEAVVRLLPSARSAADKQALVDAVVGTHGEGFVAKHCDDTYREGKRSPAWRKVKLTSCADVVVVAVSPDGRENYEIAVVDGGALVPVGSIAWNHRRSDGLLAVGDVVEVRYLYVGAQQRLVQPRIVRRRTDKTAAECTADQLRAVNKSVVPLTIT